VLVLVLVLVLIDVFFVRHHLQVATAKLAAAALKADAMATGHADVQRAWRGMVRDGAAVATAVARREDATRREEAGFRALLGQEAATKRLAAVRPRPALSNKKQQEATLSTIVSSDLFHVYRFVLGPGHQQVARRGTRGVRGGIPRPEARPRGPQAAREARTVRPPPQPPPRRPPQRRP